MFNDVPVPVVVFLNPPNVSQRKHGTVSLPSVQAQPTTWSSQSLRGALPVDLLPLLKGEVSTQQSSLWQDATGTFKEPFWASFPDDSLQWTLRANLDTTAWIHFGRFSRALSPPLWDKKEVHVRYKMRLWLFIYFIIFAILVRIIQGLMLMIISGISTILKGIIKETIFRLRC